MKLYQNLVSMIKTILYIFLFGIINLPVHGQTDLKRLMDIGISMDYSPLMKYRDDISSISIGNGLGYSVFSRFGVDRLKIFTQLKFTSLYIDSEINGVRDWKRRSFFALEPGYHFDSKKLQKLQLSISVPLIIDPNYKKIISRTKIGVRAGIFYKTSNNASLFFETFHVADWIMSKRIPGIKNLFIFSVGVKYQALKF